MTLTPTKQVSLHDDGSSATSAGSMGSKLTHSVETPSSTPKEQRLIPFNELRARKMLSTELLDIYTSFMKRRGRGDATEAGNYLHYLMDRLSQQEEYIKASKVATENYITLEQVVDDQKNKINELQQKIKHLEKTDYKIMLEETSTREAELAEKINNMDQLIKQM